MARRLSRAYKLKLSEEGIALFLDCHCRLCHLAGDFLPYGTTLHVAVALLAQMTDEDLAAEVSGPDLGGYGGKEIRFVGTSPDVAVMTAQLTARLAACHLLYPLPQTWKLYLVGLCCMKGTEDRLLTRLYDRLCRTEGGMRPRRARTDSS